MVTGFQMQLPPKHINTGNPSKKKKKWGEVFHGLAKNNGYCQNRTQKRKLNFLREGEVGEGGETTMPSLAQVHVPALPTSHIRHMAGSQPITTGAALILEFCWNFVVLISVELDILRAFKPFLFWREFHYDSICSPGQGLTLGGMGRLWSLCGSHPLLSPLSPLLFAFSLCCSSGSALSLPPTCVGSTDQEIPLLSKAWLEVFM